MSGSLTVSPYSSFHKLTTYRIPSVSLVSDRCSVSSFVASVRNPRSSHLSRDSTIVFFVEASQNTSFLLLKVNIQHICLCLWCFAHDNTNSMTILQSDLSSHQHHFLSPRLLQIFPLTLSGNSLGCNQFWFSSHQYPWPPAMILLNDCLVRIVSQVVSNSVLDKGSVLGLRMRIVIKVPRGCWGKGS